MAPELQILILNAACLAVAYGGIYPSMRDKRIGRLAVADGVVTLLALGTAAALFAGSGTRFRLIGMDTNWFVFALLTYEAISLPLLIRFLRRHDIDIAGGRE